MPVTRMPSLARALAIVMIASAWAASAFAQAPAAGLRLEVQVKALDLLERAGRAQDERRFREAAALYRQAAELNPDDGQPLVLAGVAAYQIPALAAAGRDLRQALSRPLAPEDRDLARLYLGLITEDLRRPSPSGDQARPRPNDVEPSPWSAALTTTAGGGYDSNARQTAPGSLDADGATLVPQQAAVYGAASVELALGRRFDGGGSFDFSYAVEQSAYENRAFADLDFQEHVLALEFAHPLDEAIQAALAATADLSFTGVATQLRAFQRSLRLDPQLLLGAGMVRVRLAAAWQQTSTLDPTYSFLSGRRLEASMTPQLAVAGWRASVMGRLRRDDLGSANTGPQPSPDDVCPECTAETVVPYSNKSVGATARLAAPFSWRLRPAMSARWELRGYDQPQRTQRQGPFGIEDLGTRIRRDTRLGLGGSLTLRLTDDCTLTARYDHLRLWSNHQRLRGTGCPAGTSCDAAAGDRRGYRKHGLTLDLSIEWS
jgi:tetratricopeptide (TPR) repeat protein